SPGTFVRALSFERIRRFDRSTRHLPLGSFLTTCCAGLPRFIAQDSLTRKLNLVSIFADALDHNLLPFTQFIAHVANASIGNFGNVEQTIRAGEDFHKRSEIYDPAHRSNISLAHLSLGSQPADPVHGRLCGRTVGGGN